MQHSNDSQHFSIFLSHIQDIRFKKLTFCGANGIIFAWGDALLAALFDLDGTLLDSLGVWAGIDRAFFLQNGLEMPDDYTASISGLSFIQTAEYTKERFHLMQSAKEIAAIWHEMCKYEYAARVLLKSGAAEYLTALKSKGIKLAVVTTLTRELYEPVLTRNKVYHLFDTFATTDESGQDKSGGEVYRLAAKKLHVANEDCAVFEDIYEGIVGAKRAGMCACLVYDRHNARRMEAARQLCDHYIETYEGLNLWI